MQTSFRLIATPRVPFRAPRASASSRISEPQGSACDCAHHRLAERSKQRQGGWFGAMGSTLLPLLLCAFCPACLGVWAPLLGIAGWGVQVNETTHGVMLVVGVGLALSLTAWRARKHRQYGPLLLTAQGSGFLLLSHWLGDWLPATLLGVASLLGASYLERGKQRGAALRVAA
jgi:hypothetical protein